MASLLDLGQPIHLSATLLFCYKSFVDVTLKNTQSRSYHGADHAADVDGVTASRNVISRVLHVFVVEVQYLHTNVHHAVLKLGRKQEKFSCS